MLANLAAHLIEAEAITTTETKAKALRPYVEKLVTKAKVGGVHKQRQVVATITTKDVSTSSSRIGPRYTRPQRRLHADPQARPRAPGDNAPMARIEFV
jgi:large subunit ribosomal protein L17